MILANLVIDSELIEEARKLGRHKTKKEAVRAALAEYVARRKRLEILSVFGTVDFDPKYDYKAERKKSRTKKKALPSPSRFCMNTLL